MLVALTDRDDRHHERCRGWLSGTSERLLIPPTVLAEACYLIDRELGPEAEALFLDDVGTTDDFPYQLVDLSTPTFGGCRSSYADRPIVDSAARMPQSWPSGSGSG